MYESAVELGIEKAHSPVWRTFVLAIQAGLQVRSRCHVIKQIIPDGPSTPNQS
jgi:hypothetical protein